MKTIQWARSVIAATILMSVSVQAKYCDDETDLVYYGHRYCNPSTGRWLSRDPIGEKGGLNLYGFVKNESITLVDPLGKSWLSRCGGIVCAAAYAKNTEQELQRASIPDRDDENGGNAFLHCVIACRVSRACNDEA